MRSLPRAQTTILEGVAVLTTVMLLGLALVVLPREMMPVTLMAGGMVAMGVFVLRPLLVLLALLAIYPFYMVIAALFLSDLGGVAGAAVAAAKELLLLGLFVVTMLSAGRGAWGHYPRVWVILAGFYGLVLILFILTPAPLEAAARSARFHLTYPLLLPIAVSVARTPIAARQIGTVVLCAAAVVAVGWLSVLGWVGLSGMSYAAATTQLIFPEQDFGDPINVLGTYMAISTCLAVGFAQHAPNARWRLGFYGLSGIFAWALLTTFSRRSIIAAVLGIVVIAWLGRRWRLLMTLAVACGLVVAFGSVYLLRRLSVSYAAEHEGTWIRLYHLQYTLENMDPLSFFTGHGMGTAGHIAVAAGMADAVDLHNYYLLLLFESGIFGLTLYLVLCWSVFRHLRGAYRRLPEQWAVCGLVLGALGAFPAFLATGMFGIGNAVLPNAPLIWVLLGTGLAAVWWTAPAVPGEHSTARRRTTETP